MSGFFTLFMWTEMLIIFGNPVVSQSSLFWNLRSCHHSASPPPHFVHQHHIFPALFYFQTHAQFSQKPPQNLKSNCCCCLRVFQFLEEESTSKKENSLELYCSLGREYNVSQLSVMFCSSSFENSPYCTFLCSVILRSMLFIQRQLCSKDQTLQKKKTSLSIICNSITVPQF